MWLPTMIGGPLPTIRCCRTTSVRQRISIQLRFSSFRVFLRIHGIPSHSCANRTVHSFATDFPPVSSVSFLRAAQAAWPIGGDSSRNRIERACSVSVTILEARYSNVKKEAWVKRFRISRTRYSEKKLVALSPNLSSPERISPVSGINIPPRNVKILFVHGTIINYAYLTRDDGNFCI